MKIVCIVTFFSRFSSSPARFIRTSCIASSCRVFSHYSKNTISFALVGTRCSVLVSIPPCRESRYKRKLDPVAVIHFTALQFILV